MYVGIGMLVLTLVCLGMRWNAAAFVFGGTTLAGFVVLSAMASETQLDMVASCPPQLARPRRTAVDAAPPPQQPAPQPQWQQQLQQWQQAQAAQAQAVQWQQAQQWRQWQQLQQNQQEQAQRLQAQRFAQEQQEEQAQEQAQAQAQEAQAQAQAQAQRFAQEEQAQEQAPARLSRWEYVSDEPASAADVRARGLYGIKPDFNDEIMQRGAVMNKGFIQPLAARSEFARYLAYDLPNRRDQFMVRKDSP